MKRGSSAKRKDVRKIKSEIKSWRIPEKKTKRKEKYLVSLKREKELAGKGWKVKRTKKYTEKPKEATGKKGYPYAVLNKEKNYESFYTWKEKSSKKKKKPLKGTGGAFAKKGGSLKKGLKELGSLRSPSKKRKGTIRHEAFKVQQAKLHKKSQRKVKIESLKKSRKRKF